MRFRHDFLPIGDLLVDVDFDWTHVGATAVQRRGERQLAVFVRVERRVKNNADRTGIGRPVAETAAAPKHGQVFMHAPQRIHFSDGQNFSMPSRSDRPLSTRTTCTSPPARGPRKCDVYCVIGEPKALRDKSLMNTARWSTRGMTFSIPTETI